MNNYRIIEMLGPSPLTLEKARKHLNILPDSNSPPSHPDDELITDAIDDAVAWAENFTLRAIRPKRYETMLACFPPRYLVHRLPFGSPLIDLESIHYMDVDGVEQLLPEEQYKVLNHLQPASFEQTFGQEWPAVARQSAPIRVTYSAGYDQPALFPGDIMRALKQIMAEFFENREDSTPLNQRPVSFGAKNLLQPYRLYHRNAT